jgi:hypothetical protein
MHSCGKYPRTAHGRGLLYYVGGLGPDPAHFRDCTLHNYVGVLGPHHVGVLGPDPAHHVEHHLGHLSKCARAEPARVSGCLGSEAFRFGGVVTACPQRAHKLAELW